MKMYVFDHAYEISYGDSCYYVLARNLREARKLMQAQTTWKNWSKIKPTRVFSKPTAELYSWEE